MVIWLLAAALPPVWLRRALPAVEDRMLISIGVASLSLWFAAWLIGYIAPLTIAPHLITLLCLAVFAAPVVYALSCLRRPLPAGDTRALVTIALPALLLMIAGYLVVTGFGILWTGAGTIVEIQQSRYLAMPGDHIIPDFFASGIRNADIPSPLMGDWYSADRPPLQVGFLLLFAKVLEKGLKISTYNGDGYLGIACQALFIVATYRFVRTLTACRRAASVACVAAFLVPASGLYIFYPWPKLLSAAYLLIAAAITIDLLRRRTAPARVRSSSVVFGIATSLALLSHGGVIFAIIPLTVAFIVGIVRTTPSIRTALARIVAVLLAAAITYLPWWLYGKVTGEDHSRLLKWHLGGDTSISDAAPLPTIIRAYETAGWHQTLASKVQNIEALIRQPGSPTKVSEVIVLFQQTPAWRVAESQVLMYAISSVVLWIVPLVILLLSRHRRSITRFVGPTLWVLAWIVSSIFVWCLLMFLPGSTVPHQGPIVVIFLPTILGAALVSLGSFRGALITLLVQSAAFIYVTVPPNSATWESLPPIPVSHTALAMILLGIAASAGGIALSCRPAVRAN